MASFWKSAANKQINFAFGAERHVWIAAVGFVAALSCFEWFAIGLGFPQYIADLYQKADTPLLIIGVVYVAASLYLSYVFVLSCLTSRWPYKIFYVLVFGVVFFAEYAYAKALGRFTNFYDVVSAFSATSQQSLDSIYAYADLRAFIPLSVLVVLCFMVQERKTPSGVARLILVMAVTAIFYIHFYYVNQLLFDRSFLSSSFGSFWQTNTDYLMLNPFGRMQQPKRTAVELPAPIPTQPANNIVFVFDESVRADHLSLNGYARPTTPYLESLARQNLLLNWGTAVSASTISHPSYDAMLTGATPEMVETKGYDEICILPTLFQFAKAMNYRTHLIDGQMSEYWGGTMDDLAYVDNFVSLKDIAGADRIEDWQRGSVITNQDNENNSLKQWEIDRKLAAMVNEIFTTSTGNFLFVYKRGAHFPYEKNYPESEARWRPIFHFTDQFEVPPADKFDAIVNSYDNALAYNIDDFFKRLSSDPANLPNNTVIIYTSDHGESFFVNGKAGHGGTTREEAMVPLFILGLKDRHPDTGFRATHANVFSALLDLMKVPVEARKQPYQMSLFNGTADMPVHRSFNPPPGKKYSFD